MASSPVRPRRHWNTKWNWIVALAGILIAFPLLFAYQWVWLPALFSDLLARGLPGAGDTRTQVYAVTTAAFALIGVGAALAAVAWRVRPSWFTRILALVVACAWFVAISPGAPSRYTGVSPRGLAHDILVRAGATGPVAEGWGDALLAGSYLGAGIGLVTGVVIGVRMVTVSLRSRDASQ